MRLRAGPSAGRPLTNEAPSLLHARALNCPVSGAAFVKMQRTDRVRTLCGVRTDGTVACWGPSEFGQTDAPTGTFLSVSADRYFTCGVKTDGTLACWGTNEFGETAEFAGSGFVSVSNAGDPLCGLRNDGTIACSGHSSGVDVPSGTFIAISKYCRVNSDGQAICSFLGGEPPEGRFTSIADSGRHACGIRSGGTVACWGLSNERQTTAPAGEFTSISVGNAHSCALGSNGGVVCWGSNHDGQTTAPAGSFSSDRP